MAATVVSVGIARANVVDGVIDNEGSLFTVALLLGLIFIAMGGLTVFTLPAPQAEKALARGLIDGRPMSTWAPANDVSVRQLPIKRT